MKLNLGKRKEQRGGSGTTSSGGWRLGLTSDLSVFLLFLALATIFWLLQALQGEYTTKIHIPLSCESIPAVNSLQEEVPEQIEVGIRDKGFELLRLTLTDIEPIQLKVKYSPHKSTLGITKAELMESLSSRLSSSAKIQYVSPSDISIPLMQRKQKVVPIQLKTEGLAAPGYLAYPPEITPAVVTIYGAQTTLDSINHISVRPLKESQLSQTITTKGKLETPRGVSLSTTEVQVNIRVEEYVEKTFTLPILKYGEPDGFRLNPLPSLTTLKVTFPRSRYSEFVEADFEVGVTYPSQTGGETSSDRHLTIEVKRSPSWAKRIVLNPEVVQYVIEKQ